MRRDIPSSRRLARTWRRAPLPLLGALALAVVACTPAQSGAVGFEIECVHQGPEASDAFSAVHDLGGGRIVAGKRSSTADDRFLLSTDLGATWSVVPCPGSTGANTYFFGQHGERVFAGTGDAGDACLMRSDDKAAHWAVALSSGELRALVGSADVAAVFGPVHLGGGRWVANLKSFDTPNKVIRSIDDGATWSVPAAQPGQGRGSWARRMSLTRDGVLLWPECTTDRMYRSTDGGESWSFVVVPGARLFQPLCDAGDGTYFCGDVALEPAAPMALHRSTDRGLTWSAVVSVNLQRPTITYWRDVLSVRGRLYASACCVEGTSDERFMRLYVSTDGGTQWTDLGNPYVGPYGGMQAIYAMCATEDGVVFAGCQPDSTILRWRVPAER